MRPESGKAKTWQSSKEVVAAIQEAFSCFATLPRGLAILSASLSGEGHGYGLLGNKGATLLMGCDSRRSPTRNSFLPSGMLNRDHYHARKNY
ncbi:hypothetical protein J6590_091064 [Homalodisca vitripennis]|nr:hypothetical protein J6590_091064 [Homalodisca vitripennis]